MRRISGLRRHLALIVLACANYPASAAVIIWDQSAVTAGGTTAYVYANTATGQNFSEPVYFASSVQVTGIDIYTVYFADGPSAGLYGAVGTPVLIRLWSGSPSGAPQEFLSSIGIRDFDGAPPGQIPTASPGGVTARVHADLSSPVTLNAGNPYWIGMSLAPNSAQIPDLGMATMLGGSGPLLDGTLNQYNGTTLLTLVQPPIGDGQFRLWGVATAVPEPASLWLMGLGLAGLALAVRRRGSVPSWMPSRPC